MSSTMLDYYRALKDALEEQAKTEKITAQEMFLYEELLYRIHVLEVFRYLTAAAPPSTDLKEIGGHFQAVDAMVSHLCRERRLRASTDEKVQKSRETAHRFLLEIVSDYRKRFTNYMPGDIGQYEADIWKVIRTLLPAWQQYRDTMLKI